MSNLAYQVCCTGLFADYVLIKLFLDINSMINSLLEKRKAMEAEDQSIEVEVMLNFLMTTKTQKHEVCYITWLLTVVMLDYC